MSEYVDIFSTSSLRVTRVALSETREHVIFGLQPQDIFYRAFALMMLFFTLETFHWV